MNASVAIQILPMSQPEAKILSVVDAVIAYIAKQGLNYEVSAFETTIEGDYDTLMKVVTEVPKVAAEVGADATMTYVKINYQPNNEALTIAQKTEKFKH